MSYCFIPNGSLSSKPNCKPLTNDIKWYNYLVSFSVLKGFSTSYTKLFLVTSKHSF